MGHDVAEHLDPKLLTGWRTWLHLTIQWIHLVVFALWVGLTAGTLLLRVGAGLDHLLYSSWIIFLVMLATGTYNAEWSAGISETPSLFLLPVLERIPYGVPYTVILTVKVALYAVAALMTLVITVIHLRYPGRKSTLRRVFLISGSTLSILIALATAALLFYHEVADIWPNQIHSLGGIMGPDGPLGRVEKSVGESFPNDFQLLETKDAWIDIGIRWVHLLGFALLLGGTAIAAVFKEVSPKRFLQYSWIVITIQILSGIGNMERWTPFYVSPYFWNSTALAHIRFGSSYTFFMAAKHGLVVVVIAVIAFQTYQYFNSGRNTQDHVSFRHYLVIETILGLAIAYTMIIVLLLHEGVDHAF
jgi:hypothetical protein